jgi:hypothetical protein
MTALIEIFATLNICTTGASRRTWGAKAHPGYDPKLDGTQSTMHINDEVKNSLRRPSIHLVPQGNPGAQPRIGGHCPRWLESKINAFQMSLKYLSILQY